MREKHPLWEGWLEEAARGLWTHPDYDRVRQELLDHLEDRTESLRRAFPDLSRKEAEQLALEGMGEAEPLSRALAQAHSSLLGVLHEVSHILLAFALVLVAVEGWILLWGWILPLAIPTWLF